MSIADAIRDAVHFRRLVVLEPEFASDTVSRTMLLHPEIANDLARAHSIPRMGRLKADLESFILGHEITLCMEPRKHRSAYMGLLEPTSKGTWDIRSRDPRPGIRVFGAFADRDIFVALHWMPRSKPLPDFDKFPLRGNENETQFAMIEAETRWSHALPGLSPKTGGTPDDYFSEKFRPVSD